MSDGAASEHHSPTTTSTTTTPVTSNAVATPPPSLEMRGALNKWTNYIHGWQTRWLVLAGGQLSYYKAPGETTLGCRGTIALHSAAVKLHPFDECRLDVCVAGDAAVWYLRAASAEQRACWAAAIERARLATAVAETKSVNAAVSSGAALTLGGALWLTTLNDKLAEVDAYRQLLVGQLSQLQTQLDAAVTSVDVRQNLSPVTAVGSRHQRSSSTSAVCFGGGGGGRTAPLSECGELRGDAVTFAATCASLVDALRQCVQLAGERDELWQRRLQREQERCSVLEQSLSRLQSTSAAAVASAATDVTKTGLEASVAGSSGSGETLRLAQFGAPDFQEGPHSTIGEDEFFDAVETALDRIHDDQELSDSLRRHHSTMTAAVGGGDSAASGDASTCGGTATAGVVVHQQQPPSPSSSLPDVSLPCGEMRRRAVLLDEVQRVTNEQLHYAMAGVDDGVWQLFAEDGDMKMYKREEEIDGLAVDPLKAVHTIDGVTAHEICWHFWAHQVRLEWETTVEQLTVLESLDDNTIIALQLHKRVWPATQRDSLFWSHLARRSGGDGGGGGCVSIVVNHSTEHDSEPARRSAANSNLVRLKLTVCMACRTDVVLPDGTTRPLDLTDGQVGGQQVTRDQLRSHITYCAVVNPGGWAPTSALRMVYRREYPRFLKRFTRYVVEQCKHRPVQW